MFTRTYAFTIWIKSYIVKSDKILTSTLTKSSKEHAKIQVPHLSNAVNSGRFRLREGQKGVALAQRSCACSRWLLSITRCSFNVSQKDRGLALVGRWNFLVQYRAESSWNRRKSFPSFLKDYMALHYLYSLLLYISQVSGRSPLMHKNVLSLINSNFTLLNTNF